MHKNRRALTLASFHRATVLAIDRRNARCRPLRPLVALLHQMARAAPALRAREVVVVVCRRALLCVVEDVVRRRLEVRLLRAAVVRRVELHRVRRMCRQLRQAATASAIRLAPTADKFR